MTQQTVLLEDGLDRVDACFDVLSVIDVDVTDDVVLRLDAAGEVFLMIRAVRLVLIILLMPLSDAFGYFGRHITLGVEEVETFIHVDDDME